MSARCASCGAEIEWAETVRRRRIPLDVEPRADGNIRVVDGLATVVQPGEGDRVSHFATCPGARAREPK